MNSVILLCTVAAIAIVIICVAAVASKDYDDNVLQRLGIAAVGFGALAKAFILIDRGWLSPDDPFMFGGIALFATGTAIKVWWHRGRRQQLRRFHGQ